nr:RNA polymerase beta'' subunit [Cryptomonas sp. NIES-345]BDA98410.1 RNA polymerase beta'' subunit [Cryptomonas sp. NIES-1327]
MKEKHLLLPSSTPFTNKTVDKKELKKLMAWAFSNYGSGRASYMADKLKELGFHYATKAGISISVEDLKVPPSKQNLIDYADAEIKLTEQKYKRGEITVVERFQKVIDTWNNSSESLKDEVIKYFKETDPLNPVYMMAFSGARGNISQVKQLVGMRGLMSDPHGQIIDLPIKSNFREGLTVTEYVISCYGARKGLVDTALRTADSGYLTRRLVDVAQDIIIREIDCGTTSGIILKNMVNKTKTLISLENRLVGRSLFETLYTPDNSEIIGHINQELDSKKSKQIIEIGIKSVYVRSPLTCESSRSVCQFCYGWSLAYGSLVDLGEAVGIIAAQSIGEPGTQLTMRTFHTGGVFTGELAEQLKAPFNGVVSFPYPIKCKLTRTRHGNEAFLIEENIKIELYSFKHTKSKLELKQGSMVFLSNNEEFEEMQVIGETTSKTNLVTEKVTKDLITNTSGEVFLSNFLLEERIDKQGSITSISEEGGIIWILEGDVYTIPSTATLIVKEHTPIIKGSVIAISETISDHEGTVKLVPNSPNELEIITASTAIENGIITTKTEKNVTEGSYILEFNEEKKFLLHCSPGNKISDSQIVGELIDNSYFTLTGGFIKYSPQNMCNLDESKTNCLLWVPEETHEVNKDISLLLIPSGSMISKQQEILKDLYNLNEGFLSIEEDNGIIQEINIKPGYLYKTEEIPHAFEPRIFEPGEEVDKNLEIFTTSFIEIIEIKKEKFFLIRPVMRYEILENHPYLQQDCLENDHTSVKIEITQKILLKDGEKIKSCNPINLLKTYLILHIESELPHVSADVEFYSTKGSTQRKLKFSIIKNLIIKKDTFGEVNQNLITSELVINEGDKVTPGTKVAQTKLLCKEDGEIKSIYTNNKLIQNILIFTQSHKKVINVGNQTVQVTKGDLIRQGDQIADEIISTTSGQITDIQNDTVTVRFGNPYLISAGTILQVNHLDLIHNGDTLAILVFERPKTGDIIQGLPRIEEILEARKPKESSRLAQRQGKIKFQLNEDELLTIKITEDNGHTTAYTTQTSQKFIISNGDFVSLGDQITDGPPNPHEILSIFFNFYKDILNIYDAAKLSLQKVQNYLVNEVQSVYQSQSVDISDKHVEVIVKQMTSKVKVEDGGDTTLLPGELVELQQIENINEAMLLTKGIPALYSPVLLGITKSSLNADSFISAASFQETTRVLTEAAVEGKADWLRGLKENVIIGRLIPAGTGFNSYSENLPTYNLDTPSIIDAANVPLNENKAILSRLTLDDKSTKNYPFGETNQD